jgi:hypothetical protein
MRMIHLIVYCCFAGLLTSWAIGLRRRGKLYTVTSGTHGVSMKVQRELKRA